jgi:CarboxypepD_reg-like domain/TonB-dependent Receptor Plug Domain
MQGNLIKSMLSQTRFRTMLLLLPAGLLGGDIVVQPTGSTPVVVSGKVVDEKNVPVAGATLAIENSLDGCLTDSLGGFSLSTSERGYRVLLITAVGYEDLRIAIQIRADTGGVLVKLRSVWRSLNGVVISAGAFTVSDKGKTVLKPMDIMTTAGADADVVKTMQSLPGTQQPGVSTGLFVRGGDAAEATIVVDQLVVQNAFFSNVPGVSQSSRFSPFQFKDISFSSGGYSARYGQAMSSVLELRTRDLADNSKLSVGANVTGIFASGAKLWKKESLEVSGYYNNYSPFNRLATSNLRFYHPPTGGGASVRYVWAPSSNETWKTIVRGTLYKSGLVTPDPFVGGDSTDFSIRNVLWYAATTYRKRVGNKWDLNVGASYSNNEDHIIWKDSVFGEIPLTNHDYRTQGRVEITGYILQGVSLDVGGEVQHFGYTRAFDTSHGNFVESIPASYVELNWRPFPWLAIRPGIRNERSSLLRQSKLSPRVSLAVRTGEYAQVGLAGGLFYQDPENVYLLSDYRPGLQEAAHLILNYQWIKSDRTFRVETYYKDYVHLSREYTGTYNPNDAWRIIPSGERVDNTGYGFAGGAELFWHDKETIKGLDYWISYSFIDTKRLYDDYLKEATPVFVANQNLSIVMKYFVTSWQTNFSVTSSFASGRPYYDPGANTFLGSKTPPFEDVSLGIGRLSTVGKWFTVIYLGIDNITNHHNLFGYQYSYNGTQKFPVLPAFYRSFLIGMNISLSRFDKSEL